jgi:hypothetical protein
MHALGTSNRSAQIFANHRNLSVSTRVRIEVPAANR